MLPERVEPKRIMLKSDPEKLLAPIRRRWLKDLRSGEFKQGSGSLCRGSDYCCLGVLAERLGLWDNEQQESNDYRYSVLDERGSRLYDILPCSLVPMTIQQRLIHMNDRGDNFEAIATWIEQTL